MGLIKTHEEKSARLQELTRWYINNKHLFKNLTEAQQIEKLRIQAMATFILSSRTARDYAVVIINRQKLNLPDSKMTIAEIRDKQEREMKAGWGDVKVVKED